MSKQTQSSNFDRFMRMPEVVAVTGLAKSTIRYCIEEGTFPTPVRLTTRAVAWRESQIRDWMDSRPKQARLSDLEGPGEG